MSTPLDKCGYTFTESYGPEKRYRLILGFESLDDLNAAQDFIFSFRKKGPAHEPCALTTKQRQDMIEKLLETGRVAHRQPFNVPANIAFTEAHKAVFDAMGPTQPPPDVQRDAERWRALVGCARVRVLGSAGLNDPESEYAHIGLELWTRHAARSLPDAIETLTAFADRASATKEAG
jgi:hypothetical protein